MYFIFNNCTAFAAAALLSDCVFSERPIYLRVLAALAGFPVVVLTMSLTLLTAGMYDRVNAAIFSAVICAVSIWLNRFVKRRTAAESVLCSKAATDRRWIAAGIAVFLAAGFVLTFVMPGSDFKDDDLSYHATFAAHCISEKTLNIVPYIYHCYYPFNAETMSMWFVLPFGSDGFASLSGVLWMCIIILSGLSICSTVGCPKYTAAIICVLLFSSQICKEWMRAFSSVDLATAAMTLAAAAIVIDGYSYDGQGKRHGLFAAGLFAGYALGCKVSFAPASVVMFVWIALYNAGKEKIMSRCRSATALAAGVLLTGSFWYIRNYVLTGNPIFPAEVGPFGGPFDSVTADKTKLITWILDSPTDLQQWKFLISEYVAWPVSVFAVSLAGYVFCWAGLLFYRKRIDRVSRAACSMLLWLGSIFLCFYPFMPFSGMNDWPEASLKVELRFVILPWAIGIILLGVLLRFRTKKKILWLCILSFCSVVPFFDRMPYTSIMNLAVLTAVLVSVGSFGWMVSRFGVPRFKVYSMIVFFAVMTAAIAVNYERMQEKTDANLYRYGQIPQYRHDPENVFMFGLGRESSIPAGSVITSVSPIARYYGLFGRHYQYVPKRVDRNGNPWKQMHIRWKRNPENMKWWGKRKVYATENLAENLCNAGVDYVFMQKKKKGWPVQYEILERSDKARQVYIDKYIAIWQLSK